MIFWVLVFAWLAIYPLLTTLYGSLWFAHVGVVIALGLVALPRLLRRTAVRPGMPGLLIATALLSLLVSVLAARPEFPRAELCWAAVTGCAHALFFALCLFLLLPEGDERPGAPRRAALLLAALLLAMVAGQAAVVVHAGQLSDPALRPSGTLGNPNALGTLLAAAAVALVGLLRLRGLAQLLIVPLLVAVVFTESRGALLALVLTLLLLALRLRLWRLLGVLGAGVLLLVLIPNPLRARIEEMRPEHQFSRLFIWERALESIAANPLGIGPAMNRYVFPAVALDPKYPWLLHQRHTVGLTHNVFLTLTLEWGWLAGAALIVLAWWAGRRFLLPAIEVRGRDDPLLSGACLGACLMLLELQWDGIEQNPCVFSLFLLLLAAALSRVLPATGPAVSGRAMAALLLVAVLGLGTALVIRLRGWTALDHAETLAAAFARGESDAGSVRAAYDAAESAAPGDLDVPMRRFEFERTLLHDALAPGEAPPGIGWPARALPPGEAEGDDTDPVDAPSPVEGPPAADAAAVPVHPPRQDVDVAAASREALAALARARARSRADPRVPRIAGRFELWLARHTGRPVGPARQRAVEDLAAALQLDPLDVEGHWELAQEAQRAGDKPLHDRELQTVFSLAPDYAFAFYAVAREQDLAGNVEAALFLYDRADRALQLCRERVLIPNTKSQAFYERNLSRVDVDDLHRRIGELLRMLYF